jgi:hypothetical protein
VYLLPAYPFIALLGALSLERCASRYPYFLTLLTRLVVFVGFFIVGGSGAAIVLSYLEAAPVVVKEYSRAVWGSTSIGSVALGVGFAACAWRLFQAQYPHPRTTPLYVRLSVALIGVVAIVSSVAVGPIIFAQSPKEWVTSAAFPVSTAQRTRPVPFYSFGSEAYATSFYLKKPFKRAVGSLAPGSIVVVQQRDLAAFREKFSSEAVELGRFESAFDESKRALVVVETR